MRILLDTHALLWWLSGDDQLPVVVREAVADPVNAVYVSAASAWEIATKARIGKLPGVASLAQDFANGIATEGFLPLPISLEHAGRAGGLPGPHRDPFDRLLIAQAQAENLILASSEEVFDGYGVTRLWAAA